MRGRRGARLAAITSGGAIPETAQYAVVAEPEGKVVGTLDEDFAVESLAGDVFLLGTTPGGSGASSRGASAWRMRMARRPRFRSGAAKRRAARSSCRRRCRNSRGDRAAIPSAACIPGTKNAAWMTPARKQAIAYVQAGVASLGALPTQHTVVAERFFDEAGGMQLVIHAPFGSRINRAWGLALRKRFCRTFNFELQAAATDNGIVISLSEQHAFPLELVFDFLKPQTVEHVLTQALLDAPMFAARWRWNASRALAIPRFRGGRKVPPPIQRMRADDLLASVFPDQVACAENLTGEIRIPDHPLVNETIANCLHEAMDMEGLNRIFWKAFESRRASARSRSITPSRRRFRTKS